MEYTTLSPNNDPMGAAIRDYQNKGKASRLRVLSSMFDEDEMPVAHLFRTFNQMPRLEQKALSMAKGRVLDIVAGAGCHALALQERGVEVKAIDISPLSCEVMKERAQLAISWVRVHSEEYGIDPERLKKCDLHIHAPEGAVPKDGPSAWLLYPSDSADD